MAELSDKVEEIRRREVREGRYYPCPQKMYAERVRVEGISRCKGSNIGGGGHHLPVCCEQCEAYYSG